MVAAESDFVSSQDGVMDCYQTELSSYLSISFVSQIFVVLNSCLFVFSFFACIWLVQDYFSCHPKGI